jgi:hydroxyacyl-ACP dehydratase HTD2-like protein with hotdog domain
VLLLDLARREERRPVKRLVYRALRPIFHTERFTVNGRREDGGKAELWTADAAGNLAMTATAHF